MKKLWDGMKQRTRDNIPHLERSGLKKMQGEPYIVGGGKVVVGGKGKTRNVKLAP